jgi:phage tail-like protein
MAKRNDPATTFQFAFKITEGDLTLDYTNGTAFFKSVTGLKVQQDIQDVNEGGVSSFTRKVQGVFKWPNLVLKQGFTGDKKLFNFKKDRHQRINGVIFQLGPKLNPICKWEFYGGYCVKWEGPDFDAQKNEVAIETIEIAHEGLVMNPEPPKKPDPPPPPPPKPEAPVNATVNFGTNSSTVPSDPKLDSVADGVKKDPKKKLKIEGHTDSVGDAGYNKTLSQQRADAVKKYLIDQGTDPAQIVSCIGYGEDKPIADNSTASGRSQNRRTTVEEEKA